MRKLFFFLSLFVFIFFSCEKEMETRIIQGYIYKNCKEPFANLNITVEGFKLNAFSPSTTTLGIITTDENGYYSLSYESNKKFEKICFYDTEFGHKKNIIEVPYQDNLELFHYVDGRSTHKLSFRLNSSFGQQDTLYLGRYTIRSTLSLTPPFYTLVGPFEEGRNYKIKYGELREYSPWFELVSSSYVREETLFWALGRAEYNAIYMYPDTLDNQILKDIKTPICGQGSELIIDLREK